jgi:hypothetical protein
MGQEMAKVPFKICLLEDYLFILYKYRRVFLPLFDGSSV